MSEMAAVCLELHPAKPNRIPAWLGRASQAFLLATAKRYDPLLATKLHDTPGMKPFTASSLGGGLRSGTMRDLSPAHTMHLRFTSLHPDITTPLLTHFLPLWREEGITLHDQLLLVDSIATDAEHNIWAGQDSYHALYEAASDKRRIFKLRFDAPTIFKRTGGNIIPMPMPDLAFGSLMDRWNRFAPFHMPEDLFTTISEQIVIEQFEGKTEQARVGKGRRGAVPGFVGSVRYRLRKASKTHVKAINALANYAVFSSVGAKTTMGLGQATRIVASNR